MPKPYRLLITGSRDWPDPHKVWTELDVALARLKPGQSLTVVHGAATRGADFDAHTWCLHRQNQGVPVTEEKHRADWTTHRQKAGPIRNQHMVDLGADECHAFITPCSKPDCPRPQPHGSHGASHCAQRAEQAGIPVHRWTA